MMDQIVRKSKQRGLTKTSWLESYHTFSFGHYFDPEYTSFGSLRVLNEDYVSPEKGFHAHGHKDIEMISYVLEGSLSHQDNLGFHKTLHAGDVQFISAGTGILHTEMNPEKKQKTHFLQIWITPKVKGLRPKYQYRHIEKGEGVAHPVLLFSPEGKDHSIPIQQNIEIYMLRLHLHSSYHFSQPLYKMCWIHVVEGSFEIENQTVKAGDGVGMKGHGEIHIKALQAGEIWIFSMPHQHAT